MVKTGELFYFPHDWSIEDLAPNRGAPPASARLIRTPAEKNKHFTAYTVGGIGWSSKHIHSGGEPAKAHRRALRRLYAQEQPGLDQRPAMLGDHPHGYTGVSNSISRLGSPEAGRQRATCLPYCVRNEVKTAAWIPAPAFTVMSGSPSPTPFMLRMGCLYNHTVNTNMASISIQIKLPSGNGASLELHHKKILDEKNNIVASNEDAAMSLQIRSSCKDISSKPPIVPDALSLSCRNRYLQGGKIMGMRITWDHSINITADNGFLLNINPLNYVADACIIQAY